MNNKLLIHNGTLAKTMIRTILPRRLHSLIFSLIFIWNLTELWALQSSLCAVIVRPSFLLRPSNVAIFAQPFSEEDDYDDDDDDPPEVDIANFRLPETSFGLNKGRSSPSQRKAMGRSSSSTARIYICSNCASEFVKWMGRCPTCREWNTIQEHAVQRQPSSSSRPVFGSTRPASWLDGVQDRTSSNIPIRVTDLLREEEKPTRRRKRIIIPNDDEFNTVLGGGIMPGSLILVGGDPGVGKSTLLLQTAGAIAALSTPTPGIGMGQPEANDDAIGPVWYVSGEENPDQIASRAMRLGVQQDELWLLGETHADSLCELVVSYMSQTEADSFRKHPSLVVIDSIQTMVCEAGGNSAAGGITQVRECVALFLRLAKSTNIPIFLVGHVTKSGDVAGPRTVEHMVDCVLYLEGAEDGGTTSIRMLRASKNRFGSADEVGVYEMTSGRLLPVSDPSSLFLAHRVTEEDSEGCAIALALEGMRAMTIEVQALVTPAGGGASSYARRTVQGIATSRLLLLLGVLQKRCGIFLGKQDIYVNVAGRIRLDRGEGHAADLAVALSLVSSLTSVAVRSDTAFVGEVGLLGELRPIPAIEKRLQEARRMGFSRVVTPRNGRKKGNPRKDHKLFTTNMNGVLWIQCETLLDAINAGLVNPLPTRKARKQSNAASSKQIPTSIEDLGLDEVLDDDDAFL